MKIDAIEKTTFAGVYAQKRSFNKKERNIVKDITSKLLYEKKPNDVKKRTWEKWLKEEKKVDIYIRPTPETCNSVRVYGIRGAKKQADIEKMKNSFIVGDYRTKEFNPEDIVPSDKNDMNGTVLYGALALIGLIAAIFALNGLPLKKSTINKEIPSMIQAKDSIVDSLKNMKQLEV